MKVTIRVVQVITAMILLFFSIGMFKESFQFETQIFIDAPLSETYAIASDPTFTVQWMNNIKRHEQIQGSGTSEGSKWVLSTQFQDKEIEFQKTIRRAIPNEQFEFVLESNIMNIDVTMHYKSQDKGTLLSTKQIIRGNGILWRSVLPFMKSSMQDQAHEEHHKLKQVVIKNNGL